MSNKEVGSYLLAKQKVNDWLFKETKGTVLTGPFTGMKLPNKEIWNDGNLGTKVLGCYEEELHATIECEIIRLSFAVNPKIVDIGCAEGYYAVGLAKRLPRATVLAIDTCDEALAVLKEAQAMNEVDNVVTGLDLATTFAEPDLVISDCEGDELIYLDKDKFPGLVQATIIVECHTWRGGPNTSQILYERFLNTHEVETIREGARDPNRWEFLRPLHSAQRWMAVCEGRPCMMHWFVMQPREGRPDVVAA